MRSRQAITALTAWLLYACGPAGTNGDGGRETPPDQYPDMLSAWQLMTVSDDALRLADDVLPYDLATPLFSDYALKLRTIRLPEGTAAEYREHEPFSFPVGTVISKTFYYPRRADGGLLLTEWSSHAFDGLTLDLRTVRLIETRLLVHEADGWKALPYIWDETQREARLRIQGDIRHLVASDPQGAEQRFTYLIPNRNECGGCHITDEDSGQLQPIGPAARHLNRTAAWQPQDAAGQLQTWADRGILTGLPEDMASIPAHPVWEPGAGDRVQERARAWLDVNCGHCHQPGGPADNSGLFLHAAETSMLRLGQCKPPVAAGRGTGGQRFSLQPGQADASILYHRVASTEPDVMMPELGRSLVHASGLTLIGRWIDQLPGDC